MPYTASSARDQSAQIMMQAAQNFTKGVQEYFQKQEQRQKQEATIDWLEQSGTANSLFPQLGQVQDPAERRKVITAGIKGAGLENLVQVQQFMAQQEQRTREAAALEEMRRAQATHMAAQTEQIRQVMADREAEARALEAATAPAEMLAPATEDGSGQAPGWEPDRRMAYLNAGGRNPQLAALLMKEPQWQPRKVQLDEQDAVIMTSPQSAVPAPSSRPSNKRPKSDQPETSADGRFYRSGPEDDWKPIPQDKANQPMEVKEWFMAGKPEGTYAAYLQAHNAQVRGAGAAAPAAKGEVAKADKFETGKVYKDANGNRAKYLGNGKWQPL